MAYVPAYKLSKYPGSGGSAQASPEGILAFLSRVRQAQQEADNAEDLRIQEQVASGTISIDDQINYNKTRQARFLPTSKEYQQLSNNIADLNVSKKWQVLSTMDSNGQPKTDQIKYLSQWLGTLTSGSDLANNVSDRIGKLQIQANQDTYAKNYEAKRAGFSLGQLQRKDVLTYLQQQLGSTNDETLRGIIQADIDTQTQELLNDTSNFRDVTLAQLDQMGGEGESGAYLGLLESLHASSAASGDAASVARLAGDIDTQRRYLVGVTIDRQLHVAYTELLTKPGTASNEKYLSTLRAIQGQTAGDFSYVSPNGTHRTLHIDNLQELRMNSGTFSGDTLTAGVNKQLSQFITTDYIPDKAAEITTQFNKMANLKGASYDQLFAQAQKLSDSWNKFKSQDFLVPFASTVNKYDSVDASGVQGTLLLGLTAALGNNFSSGKETDQGTLQKLESVQKLFPAMSGVDFQEKVAIPLQQKIGTQNFNKFIEATNAQFNEQVGQIDAARSILGSKLSANQIDQPTYAAQAASLDRDRLAISNSLSQFGKQYTGAAGDSYLKTNYSKFLPDRFGRYQAPKVNIPKLSGTANTYAPAPKLQTFGTTAQNKSDGTIRVPDPSYLANYSESELERKNGNIYLKSGVPVRW